MEGADIFKNAFKNSSYNSILNLLICKNKEPQDDKKNKIIMIEKKWPNPVECDNPSNLNWENFGYSKKNRLLRSFVQFLITIIILGIAIMTISYISSIQLSYQPAFKIPVQCPSTVTKDDAYIDQLQLYE